MIPALLAGGFLAYIAYDELSGNREKREAEERRKIIEKEEIFWNDGRYPHCGKKWHTHSFYPAGSHG